MHLILADHALLYRIEQLGLVVVDHAFPVVDDDGIGALVGAAVDLGALVGYVRIGDRDHQLSILQPVAVEYGLHGSRGATHDVGAVNRGFRIGYGRHIYAVTCHIAHERRTMFGAGAVDVDAPDRPHASYGFERGVRLLAGAEQAERRRILA